MKKLIFIALTIPLLFSCNSSEIDSRELSGFWEIDYVMFANATTKKYALNTTVDYIESNEGKGFIQKVQPVYTGKYQSNNDKQYFTYETSSNEIKLNFENGIRESVVALSSDRLSIKTQDGTIYYYKRHHKINE